MRHGSVRQILRVGASAILLTIVLMSLAVVLPTSLKWLVPGAIGLGLFGYGLAQLRFLASVRNWTPIEGTVLSTSIAEVFVGGATPYVYEPAIRFTYKSPSGTHESSRLTAAHHDHRSYDRRDIEKVLGRYPQNSRVVAYMHPVRYGLAVLERAASPARRRHFIAVSVGGAIVFFISLFVNLGLQA